MPLTWIRANLVPLLVGLSVLMAIGTVSGWVRAAGAKGEARIHRAQAEIERTRADSIEAARLTERRADSIRTAALVDSADARAARAEDARRREAEAREARERARAQALQSAADLRETLTPAQVPLFRAYETDRDMEVAALESEVESANTRADEAERENASLWTAMRAKDDLYGIATDENAALRSTNASLRAANEALARAADSGGILPDLGAFTEPVAAAIGGAIGYGLGRLTR